MPLKATGTFKKENRSQTGRIYVPAALVRDSQFPLKEGPIEIEICNIPSCGEVALCIKPKPYKE